ncbi:hypothetical protein J6590_019448 [Homalodisca vitripennis]|nr:hypothetical protein J6590_019448 [Homalodisca vitripennis]
MAVAIDIIVGIWTTAIRTGKKRVIHSIHRNLTLRRTATYAVRLVFTAELGPRRTLLGLVKEILERFQQEVPRTTVQGRPSTEPSPMRLTERHFIEKILPTGKKKQSLKGDVWFATNMAEEGTQSTGVTNVRLAYA